MASKLFILDTDYNHIVIDKIRDQVVLNDTSLLRTAERSAIEEMISYLSARYDVSNIFPALHRWTANELYFPGDYRDYYGDFFRAIKPTGANAAANRNKAPEGDNLSPDGKVGNAYYWTSYTFPNIKDWDSSETVAVGAYRVSTNTKKFYRCVVSHTNQDPETAANIYDPDTETGYWLEDDPRNAKLVEICCELALYKAHARIAPDQIPELRVQHHDMAITWLKGTAKGENSPALPRLDPDEQNNDGVQYGSIDKRNYTY